jgi:hypothetical protein
VARAITISNRIAAIGHGVLKTQAHTELALRLGVIADNLINIARAMEKMADP